jgi:hypothetical protein
MFDKFLDAVLRYPRRSAALAAAILLLLVGVLWWNLVWMSPQHVFVDMLANNLTTTSVTKDTTAKGDGQTINQSVRLEMGSTNATDWVVTATQSNSSVTSESIGTLSTGYIRYTKIAVQSGKQAKTDNFHSVLNIWGKADGKTDTSLDQLFSQTLLDVNNAPLPPIGNVPAIIGQGLVSYMLNQGVLSVNYNNAKSEIVNGHKVYTYTVLVHLGPYVRVMQSFAHALGISNLESVDPSQYTALPPVTLTMSVDKMSHQLVQIDYPAGGFVQNYSDWGLLTPISLPNKTITTTALQARIQSAQ